MVYAELNTYDFSYKGEVNPRPLPVAFAGGAVLEGEMLREDFLRFPYPVFYGGSDAKDIFKNAGVIVFTDALVYEYQPPQYYHPYPETTSMPRATEMAMPMPTNVPGTTQQPPASGSGSLQEVETIRSNFAETFLWTEVRTCANGQATVVATAPDTITSWIAGGFAVNAYSGFGMPNSPLALTVFKPFFISLNLPYSVVLGEEMALQVIVFNYLGSDQMVKVTLESSAAYANLYVDCNKVEYRLQKNQVQSLMVKAGASVSVFFPIVPLMLGYIDIQVKAQSYRAADGVRRQILVEAPGIALDYNIPVLIDLTTRVAAFKKTVQISMPPDIVPGSQFLKLNAIGDLMGPSISGLDKLLRIPTGCGEQTMLSLGPNVYITEYLLATNQLSGQVKDKALRYMEIGYQNELNYRHSDGSYSAFRSDKSGSMWLTAFVARVFGEASRHIYIDPEVLKSALRWIAGYQQADGSFTEPGRVIHKNMQGQAGSGVSLSAFVLISLLENKNVFDSGDMWYNKMLHVREKCLGYLIDQVAESTDLYLMTLAAYAFKLADNDTEDDLLDRLSQRADTSDNLIHWRPEETKKATHGSWHRPNPVNAIAVEMTSYVLMRYALDKDLVSGKRILQWITQQRNSYGGFASTQDTVVGLKALAMFAQLAYSDTFSMDVNVVLDDEENYTFKINQDNALISQRRETTRVPSEVKVQATGRGLALVEISVFFNVEREIEDTTFDLNVTILNQTVNHIEMEVCTRWLGNGSASGMAMLEVGIPSGFVVDEDSISDNPVLRKIETENKKVLLYLDEVGLENLCLSLRLDRVSLVAKAKPSYVKVYDYYEPSNQRTVFYHSSVLASTKICDVCLFCHNCNLKVEQLPEEVSPTTPLDEEQVIDMGMAAI